ncbi:cyclohexanone monooxygenase, partial [Penicillium lagena]|uniref:cyclohexanone monooxygenase n=1 Tax=Penicillium lagena TaxID=94218 RepID=UPI0025411853
IKGSNGEFQDWCDILISASGVLNSWKYPNIPGLDLYQGTLMHSANWDNSYDLTDKTVAVIGDGSLSRRFSQSYEAHGFLRSPVWITTRFGAKHARPGSTNFKYSEEQLNNFRENLEEHTRYYRNVEGELNKRFTLMHD